MKRMMHEGGCERANARLYTSNGAPQGSEMFALKSHLACQHRGGLTGVTVPVTRVSDSSTTGRSSITHLHVCVCASVCAKFDLLLHPMPQSRCVRTGGRDGTLPIWGMSPSALSVTTKSGRVFRRAPTHGEEVGVIHIVILCGADGRARRSLTHYTICVCG